MLIIFLHDEIELRNSSLNKQLWRPINFLPEAGGSPTIYAPVPVLKTNFLNNDEISTNGELESPHEIHNLN